MSEIMWWRKDHNTKTSPLMTLRDVQRLARHGHRSWLVWEDRYGNRHAAKQSPEAVKQCLLDSGTQGTFLFVGANDAWTHICTWRMGVNIINQYKRGLIRER